MITLVHVRKVYGGGERTVTALDDVSFHIEGSEFVAIQGASGSGKTTLLQILGALDLPTAGSYALNGNRVDGLDDAALSALRNRTIGFVFQSFNLLPRTTALENVLAPGLYSDAPPSVADAEAVMDQVGMRHRSSHFPAELSGGEQQRIAIARALVMRPSLLLADEPTGNLDAATGAQIMDVLGELHRAGMTIVMVTHDPLIAAHAQRTITISDGKIASDQRRPTSMPMVVTGKTFSSNAGAIQ